MIESTDLAQGNGDVAPPGDENISPATPPHRAVRFWQAIIVGILFVFIVFLALRLLQANRSELRASGGAPPFNFTTFDGQTISLDDLKGKGVVLNFWASWCDPCRDEAALLEATWRAERENSIVFLGLDYLDQEPAALAYLKEYDITYPNGPDLRSEAARRYGIKGVPETFFIDPEGNIVEIIIGPIVDPARMSQLLDQIRPQTAAQ